MTPSAPLRGARLRAAQLLELSRRPDLGAELRAAGIGFLVVREDDSQLGQDAHDAKAPAFIAAALRALDGIGVLASIDLARLEPFNAAREIATLDILSGGLAGLAVQPPGPAAGYARVGLRYRDLDRPEEWLDEALQVVAALWTSWEPDAVARDWSRNRFLDAAKVRPIDFEGEHLSVRGPAATPRSPQGRLPVLADLAEARLDRLPRWTERADLVLTGLRETDAGPEAGREAEPGPARPAAERLLLAVDGDGPLPEVLGDAAGIVVDVSRSEEDALALLRARGAELDDRFGAAAPGAGTLRERLGLGAQDGDGGGDGGHGGHGREAGPREETETTR
ncbi:LLM class flavin-dependent oxidoreductase [Gulosibacter sp. 10]|uniref:LLM class flavin-dependent oxidoreductase n=1 Tax=Gulosibacter sp. 10 TaxID=1255570 RepID=UPI00097F5B1C|nr:LLM class flavin-dependent oxidoreductase [Gulosibacter sp. 10]SJM55935.1 Nitrilotriacetate monooxygenase component A [Gulosibacter sp. 10]